MTTDRNIMGVPEIRSYGREVIEGGVVVRYEVRQPGEADRAPVALFRPTEVDPDERSACVICREAWPAHTMSDGICVPCFHGGTD